MVRKRKKKSIAGRVVILLFLAAAGLTGWAAVRWLRPSPVAPPEAREEAPKGGLLAGPAPEGGKGEVELYFSAPDGAALVPERRSITLSEDPLERCRTILGELRLGPREQASPLLPVDLELRSLFLVDGVLVIDLQPKIREFSAGALQEVLVWYSMVNSLILNNRGSVTAVRFLVDGAETDSILGHLDMRGPFAERPDLIRRETT